MLQDISKTVATWYAVKTKNKSEKSVAAYFNSRGIEAYVPLIEIVKKYSSRKKVYKIPLLKCYAFVKITRDQYRLVLEASNVYGFVKFGKEINAVKNSEIETLKLVTGEGIPLKVITSQFEVGQQVEITSGLLTGVKGKITGKQNKFFTIQLTSIGYDIQIDPKYLQIENAKFVD